MANLGFAGDSGSLSDINLTQGEFRAQIAALNDLMRQIAGNAAVSAGDSAQVDPLNAPFTLYVNPYTGSDEFVGGAYNTFESGATQDEIIASKLKRLEKQRLTCGFSPQRPFRTINRAVIEAAIITSKDWYTITDPAAHVDCVSIVLAPGVHTLYNDPGEASTSIASWGTSKNPTTADLIQFNPATVGGVLLPRGCSLCGADLRKVTIRPNWVPPVTDEAADYSNRRGALKITGTGYFFGFTFMDKVNENRSHHLLDTFHFASKAELDAFYAKTLSAVGDGADLASALTVTRGTEYQIVGPIDRTQAPTPAWDTTSSASPYIFNCSVRSNYGLGGAFMDGAKVEGLKSMVTANFTGVSLQKDMSCWQLYSGSSWVTMPDYATYITADPDNVRMNPARLSRHISAINNAFIQEVSIFAIGQGIHHFTDLGGEITITNSNSSFGGCAAISKGYKSFAFPLDKNWTVDAIRVPLNLSEKTGNIRRIYLGTIASLTASKITLDAELAVDSTSDTTPALLLREGYTLASGTRLWVENPTGDDWRTSLTSAAWSSANPDEINVTGALQQSGTNEAPGTNPDTGTSLAIGKRVYIRRLVDTRTPEERRLSIKLNNTATARLPQRNFVLQTDPSRAGGAISSLLPSTGDGVILVGATGSGDQESTGVAKTSQITLRRGAPNLSYATSTFYRAGSVVKYQGKHYQALTDQTTAATGGPNPSTWGETFVHMRSDFNPEDPGSNEAPIVFLDTDTSDDANSETLGINFTTGWTSAGVLRDQYRSGTDYLGVHAFLVALGFSSTNAHSALAPRTENNRDLDPTSATDFPNAPSGGAATGLGNWALEFRRPSVLRLYGHAWEWAGFLNYSKALPAAQQELGPQNKFTYFFTSDNGGRVVPQGSNEDGFNITPRGLEDIETGATLSVDAIGSATLDDFLVTDFDSLSARQIEVDNLIVRSTAQLPAVATTTTNAGPVELASAAELRSRSSVAGTTDAQRDNSINSDPVVVTKKGLEYWREYNRFISARTGIQYVYVDPVNGRDASVSELLDEPPTSNLLWNGTAWSDTKNRPAKSIKNAIGYINATYSSNETVELRIGPGYYLESGNATITCKARLYSWDFTTRSYLCDDEDGGTRPFMGQTSASGERGKAWNQTRAYLTDGTKHPIFLVRPEVFFLYTPSRAFYKLEPLQIAFEQDATVRGIVWLGAAEALVNTNVPDSFFTVNSGVDIAAVRASARADVDNALNYLIKAEIDNKLASESNATWDHMFGEACIIAKQKLNVQNCAFEAIAPSDQSNNSNRPDAVFGLSANECSLRGIWLMGNVLVSSALTGAPEYKGLSTYVYTGHHKSLVSALGEDDENAGGFNLSFGGLREITGGTGADADYNFTWNNIHLVSNSLAYRDGWNPSAPPSTTPYLDEDPSAGTNWKVVGPGYFGLLHSANTIAQNGFVWASAFVESANHYQGFAGIFGSIAYGATTRRTRGTISIPSGFTATVWRRPYFVQRAGTTSWPDVDAGQSASPGVVSALEDFDPLNMELYPIKQGIDVNNAVTVSRNVKI